MQFKSCFPAFTSAKSMLIVLGLLLFYGETAVAQQKKESPRIIVIGAHPDDCDMDAGGTAAVFASMGYAVKFLSVTNGDAGHHEIGGGMLAKRRAAEAAEAGRRFGVTYDVL